MTEQEFLDILKQTGGYISDSHIVATSGKHINTYLNKDAIYPHTHAVSKVCNAIAELFVSENSLLGWKAKINLDHGLDLFCKEMKKHLSDKSIHLTGKRKTLVETQRAACG